MAKFKLDTTWSHEETVVGGGFYTIFIINFADIEGHSITDGEIWIEVVGVMFSTGSSNGAIRRTCSMRIVSGLLSPLSLPIGAEGTQENWQMTVNDYLGDIQFNEEGTQLTVRWTGATGVEDTHTFWEMRIMAYQES